MRDNLSASHQAAWHGRLAIHHVGHRVHHFWTLIDRPYLVLRWHASKRRLYGAGARVGLCSRGTLVQPLHGTRLARHGRVGLFERVASFCSALHFPDRRARLVRALELIPLSRFCFDTRQNLGVVAFGRLADLGRRLLRRRCARTRKRRACHGEEHAASLGCRLVDLRRRAWTRKRRARDWEKHAAGLRCWLIALRRRRAWTRK